MAISTNGELCIDQVFGPPMRSLDSWRFQPMVNSGIDQVFGPPMRSLDSWRFHPMRGSGTGPALIRYLVHQ